MNEKAELQELRNDLKNKLPWQVFVLAMTLFVVGMGWVVSVSLGAAAKADQVTERVSSVEGDIKEIKSNIGWIRNSLEKGTGVASTPK